MNIWIVCTLPVRHSRGRQTHRKAASVGASMHPRHVQHGSEQTDVVVYSAERLHAFKQLEGNTETHIALSLNRKTLSQNTPAQLHNASEMPPPC